ASEAARAVGDAVPAASGPADPTSDAIQASQGGPAAAAFAVEASTSGPRSVEGRWGSREVEITEVAFLDRSGETTVVFHSGDAIAIRVKVRAAQPTDDFVFGVGLFNADGVCCY